MPFVMCEQRSAAQRPPRCRPDPSGTEPLSAFSGTDTSRLAMRALRVTTPLAPVDTLLSFPLKLKGRMDILKGTLSYFKPRPRRRWGQKEARFSDITRRASVAMADQIATSHLPL